jgi:hypothetical protein
LTDFVKYGNIYRIIRLILPFDREEIIEIIIRIENMEKIKNLGITIMEKLNVLIERAKSDKKFLGILIAIVLVVIIAVVAIVAVSCGGGEGQGTIGGGQSQEKGEKASYTVSIKSQGGMALSDIDVAIYADEKLTDMQDYAKTNENGIVNFQLVKDREYYIALSGAPKGYNVDL